MKYSYSPAGVCSRQIYLEIEDGIVKDISFVGGCNGNTKGICALVKGMKVEEIVSRLEGIQCREKLTSCPDQLAQALKSIPAEL